ncbi:MAG: DUF4331 domain-containing protein [Actinobacteria bacterium]|nr:DUF4331 domain-containing protein [Actinomycetota bacterium]
MRITKARRSAASLAALGLALATGAAVLGPGGASASSHREAPLIAADPSVDNTDVYAFVSKDRPGYVTFIANVNPFEEPNGGPNFHPFATDATYNIKIDNNGDARPDVVYRWKFHNVDKRGGSTFLYNNGPVTSLTDPNLLFRQTYTLDASFNGGPFQTRVSGAPVAPSRVGPASMPNYAQLRSQAVTSLPGGWKVFAGQADDPFFLDLRVFDLLYGGNLSETGQDTLAGYNVNTIAIQVPFKDVALNGDATRNPVIGVWSTTARQKVRVVGGTAGTHWVQVSRLGNPLVNEVVVPAGLKDAFNALPPRRDASIAPLVARVKDPEVPKLIQGIYGIPAPPAPRNDLAEIFLTGITTKAGGPIKADLNSQLNNADVDPGTFRPSEMLRLNLSIPPAPTPNRLGLLGGDKQGFPNGRRLTDDVVDIELQALEGAAQTGKLVPALAAGDGVNANDHPFGKSFPYVALPNVGAVNQGAGAGGTVQSSAIVSTLPSSAPPAERSIHAAPVGYSTGGTLNAVTTATVGAVAVALAALLITGWLMWRRRLAAVAAGAHHPPPPAAATGPDGPTVQS